MTDSVPIPAAGGRSNWGWAAYLGASWTWCIGMFLPVLLVRDYGPWAWLIFAVPNAVGAAAMGWVMRSREMGREYATNHASACRLFSFVTIAFQLFFAVWMLPRLVGPVGYAGAAVLVQSAFTPVTRTRRLLVGGAAAIIVSAVMAAGLAFQGVLQWPEPTPIRVGEAIGLLLVCLAGFLTCPYLDLTFHRARQETDDTSARFAFGVGFCVVFASMIVLTFFYAQIVRVIGVTAADVMTRVTAMLIAAHWLVQMTYTVHVHAAELKRQASARDDADVMRGGLGLWLAVGLAAGLAAQFGLARHATFAARPFGEICYRLFMAFYGLLFPAYVLLAVRRRRVSTIAWLLTAVAATPFFWLAFIDGKMAWATAGVGVMVAGVVVGRAVTRPAPAWPTE